MLPICVPCQRFFRPKKNNFFFIEGMPIGARAEPGTSEPEKWKPYKIWAADKYECPDCGAVILSGFARRPIAEHYQADFAQTVKSYGADQFQVNDCC